jgi:hypothetical protein
MSPIGLKDRRDSHHGPTAEAADHDADDRAGDAAPGDVAQHLAGRRERLLGHSHRGARVCDGHRFRHHFTSGPGVRYAPRVHPAASAK